MKTSSMEAAKPASRFSLTSPGQVVKKTIALQRRGPRSIVNLSVYAFGLSGLWTALGTPILPIKVQEVLANGGSTILGVTFTGDDKNGALGIVSLVGLAIAALTQPVAGMLSDRRTGPSKRMPFLLIGTVGMAASILFLGIVGTLIALIVLNLVIQGLGNFGQGAANGLIADHVSSGKKGAAAGVLNLSRVFGAGVMTGTVLFLMSKYDADTSPGWLMASLAFMATVAVLSTLWTVISLSRGVDGEGTTAVDVAAPPDDRKDQSAGSRDRPHDSYLRFLVALTVVITGFSALQLYSFFYLEDVIGLENPVLGAGAVLASISIATALTVLPAGMLTDRVGRDPMLVTGGALGVIATVILIFAGSLLVVVLVGLLIGVVIGVFLTVSWALANDLVSRQHAARELGYASVAVLIGSAISRISGLGVDKLNSVQDGLGYQVVLGSVAVCFVVAVALMTRLSTDDPADSTDPLLEQSVAD